MKNKHGVFLVLMIFTLIAAMSGCSKKTFLLRPATVLRGQEYGAAAGGGPMDEAKWRELGINSEAEKREFLDRAKTFENQDVYFDYDSYTLTEPAKKVLDEKLAFLKRYPEGAGDCRRALRRAWDDRVQPRAGGKARTCGAAVHS